ncbi:efflux RND transporter periplasmic adaptor subunit [Sphaerochaeta sp.]|uniref:efflux RND transporter periplasmic adaptor subunit n=1 Tax=Sphaerochaeta sp. TaxID=1972642 RepID=UPI002FCB2E34
MRNANIRFLLAVLVGSMLFLLSCSKSEQVNTPVQEVSAATDYSQVVSSAVAVTQSALRDKVLGSGIIQGQQEVVIRARNTGEITAISAKLGAHLQKDDVLLELDDTIAKLTFSQLKAQYENSVKELSVNEQLYATGAVALATLNQLRSSVDGLSAQLENAKNALTNMKITTPITGSIAEMTALVPGDMLSAGTVVARIVDVQHLRISLAVGQAQLFLIKEGDRADISVKTPDGVITTEGKVSAISAASDSRTGSWTVYVDFENPRTDLLRIGIVADVVIHNEDAPVYTLVPNSAMVYRDGKTFVFVAENDQARLVEVKVVDQYGDQTAVESLQKGYELKGRKVLVSALSRLYDGTSVSTGQR